MADEIVAIPKGFRAIKIRLQQRNRDLLKPRTAWHQQTPTRVRSAKHPSERHLELMRTSIATIMRRTDVAGTRRDARGIESAAGAGCGPFALVAAIAVCNNAGRTSAKPSNSCEARRALYADAAIWWIMSQ